MKFETKAIHAGVHPDPATGAIMTPIYQTSTYVQSAPGQHKGYEYARTQNPTRTALQDSIAALENADYGLAFASGMAAIDTILRMYAPGDEIIASSDLYGGTYRLFTKICASYGLKFQFITMQNVATLEKAITENTKLVWIETPSNPMLNVIDIEAVASVCSGKDIKLCVDNTFASPYLQNPLNLGADIVCHSATKYISGHSDSVMGLVATSSSDIAEKLAFLQTAIGAVPGPMDCFLCLRGIKTLHLRMAQHCKNAAAIADFLNEHAQVDTVNYPGLPEHKGYSIAKKQMRLFGGMLSFTLKGGSKEQVLAMMKALKVFTLAESLGGVESLLGHPATMTHASIPLEERLKTGVTDSLIRLSVGIEHADDLIEDLSKALASIA